MRRIDRRRRPGAPGGIVAGAERRLSEGTKEPSPKPVDEAARVEARGRPGATRCPYCHEACEAADDACACAECLSRHHRACWEEAGSCGSCRATRRLEAVERVPSSDPYGYAGVVDAWIRLGAVYNGLLALETLLLLNVKLLRPAVLIEVGAAAFLANLCFLLGPAIELAARRLGYRGGWLRWILFGSGLGLALLLALLVCLGVR